jgi:4-methyl-5(b-hydroxyethyl)-thiazole monophosphate biosynthesis
MEDTIQILVPIADGTEEIEAVTIINVLRRAGASVTVASVDGMTITASRGVKITADRLIDECQDEEFDMVVLPGGIPGAEHLRDSTILTSILQHHYDRKRWIGAICAAPAVVLAHHGQLAGKMATCHPGFADRLAPQNASTEPVVVDGKVVTSRGPGTSMIFALTLVELLFGQKKAREVAEPMVIVNSP